jgi:hypothetical protein
LEPGGIVRRKPLILIVAALFSSALFAETLGFFEQRFFSINFERNKWNRAEQPPCWTYTALEAGAKVDVMRWGTSNLVPFKASKNLKVVVCGSTATFDEGFAAETTAILETRSDQRTR